ncbi:MAG: ATPase [Rhizobiales bacterium]|nr:ATPase [Hyphomicrobiales bacterium]
MRRFYQATGVDAADGGYRVLLDGRPLKTPAKRTLLLPVEDLAWAVAEEWAQQSDRIQPDLMPITRLSTTANDRMPKLRAAAIDDVASYGATDLVCYRASGPELLVRRQHDAWQPALDWMARRYDMAFEITTALVPVPQPEATLERLRGVVAAIDDWPLVGIHGATASLGSVVLALALWHGELHARQAADASLVDALFEIERWGEERDAARRHETVRRDVQGAARFLCLLPPKDLAAEDRTG